MNIIFGSHGIGIGQEFYDPFSPFFPPADQQKALTGVGTFISILVANLYVLAGFLLLVFIIIGGLGMIMGAGQNDPQKVAQGKKAVTTAIIGFLIIFASYWIIQLIELLTGVNILK